MEDNIKEEMTSEAEKAEEAAAAECEEREECGEEAEKPSRQDKKKLKKLEAEREELEKKLIRAEEQIAEANDKYARLYAEFDNYRKRTAKEREGIYTDAYVDCVSEILPILDNFERALQYRDADADNVAKGLEMIEKSFAEALSKMGVSEIEALGKPFDPERHNAVMHIEDESFGENEVVEVFMKGYIKGDKVLRHSMVKVAN